jgi:hypothetical protein
MPITALDHVQLAAPPECEPAARAFFGGLLEPPGVRRFYVDDPSGNRLELLGTA